MKREELTELHYITAIENIPLILSSGLLSHQRASRVPHKSVAMQEIQDRRAKTVVTLTGRPLHEYANLYFHARNPMMYKLVMDKSKVLHLELCVVKISTDVLDVPGTVITDRNAATGYPRWLASPSGLAHLDKAMVFAVDWTHPNDSAAYLNHKAVKCAEVLVPDHIGAEHIMGAYVSCERARQTLAQLAPELSLIVDGDLFFQV